MERGIFMVVCFLGISFLRTKYKKDKKNHIISTEFRKMFFKISYTNYNILKNRTNVSRRLHKIVTTTKVIPGEVVVTPKVTPSEVVVTPVVTPSEVVVTPVVTPSEVVVAPVVTSSEGVTTPSEVVVAPVVTPSEVVTTPSEVVTTPSEVVTTPSEVVTTPSEVVTTPKKNDVINCGLCSEKHILKICPVFSDHKKKCSKTNYIGKLKNEDLNGFCAAGICLYYRTADGYFNILMIEETRNEIKKYNFLGGRRDFFSETPYQTAIRELREETTTIDGKQLLDNIFNEQLIQMKHKISATIWSSGSKYCLFCIPVNPALVSIGKAEYGNRISWLPLCDVRRGRREVHIFAKELALLIPMDLL
jgi:hypothetical protein